MDNELKQGRNLSKKNKKPFHLWNCFQKNDFYNIYHFY